MTSITRKPFLLAAAPVIAFVLAGCASSEVATSESVAPPPPVIVTQAPVPAPQVVVAPAPSAAGTVVVMPPPATTSQVVVTSPPARVVSYPTGRYQLYGDATTGYYWVWIPAGSVAMAPPTPPALPVVRSVAPATVVVARPERVVTYREGRYELYGDAAAGYYWVWIPTGAAPPPPPPLQSS